MMIEVARSVMHDYHEVRNGADSPNVNDPRLKDRQFYNLAYALCEAYVKAANGDLDPEVLQATIDRILARKTLTVTETVAAADDGKFVELD